MRTVSLVAFLLALPLLTRAGDQLPGWFNPYPEAQPVDGASYKTSASPKMVVQHYETELRTASVHFSESSFGEGTSIRAATDKTSCVVRITESDPGLRHSGSMASVACADVTHEAAPPAANPSVNIGASVDDWPQARWGMTRKEVLDAFHGDAKLTSYLPKDQQLEDPNGKIRIDEVIIGTVSLRTSFGFDAAGSLDTITLTPLYSERAPANQFELIEQSLSRKHGPPLRASLGLMFSSVWILPNSIAKLEYVATIAFSLTFVQHRVPAPASLMRGLTETRGRHRFVGPPLELFQAAPTVLMLPATSPGGTKGQAKTSCQQFVSQRLKAPATAKFSPTAETEITGFDDGAYRIAGWVDAQNSFSALIRSHYACWVTNEGVNRWSLLSAEVF